MEEDDETPISEGELEALWENEPEVVGDGEAKAASGGEFEVVSEERDPAL